MDRKGEGLAGRIQQNGSGDAPGLGAGPAARPRPAAMNSVFTRHRDMPYHQQSSRNVLEALYGLERAPPGPEEAGGAAVAFTDGTGADSTGLSHRREGRTSAAVPAAAERRS
ncbi:uncharacterized protein LOC119103265 [Pollicipes pollicipes]|uniref:uncharacterized protein LOC119103265 n=1 Tax=Pollicipes pollicipes TaxID=41117 RepID=UPI001884C4F8|nr:uncharacterized protein LOC119103265 [Pollicipes pollicipes]